MTDSHDSCSCTCVPSARRRVERQSSRAVMVIAAAVVAVISVATASGNPAAATDDPSIPAVLPNGIPTPAPVPGDEPAGDQEADPAPDPAAAVEPAPEPGPAPEPAPTQPLPVEPATPPPAPLAPAAAALPVWVFGDSIAYGTWLADPATQSWPGQLDDRLGPGQQVRNLGIGGQAVAFGAPGLQRMDGYVRDTILATPVAQRPHTIVLAGGINDLIQSTNDMYATRIAVFNLVYWIKAQIPGVKVYVATLTPMLAEHKWWPVALSYRRDVYNTWVREQWGGAGMMIDMGDLLTAGPTFGDIRYFVDSLHPDAEGATVLAHGAYDVLIQKGFV